eukprot:scaffold21819_cov65-Phaeocystis_antarctica.AAC.2
MARRREAALAGFFASGLAGMVYWPKVTSTIEAPETSLASNMAPARLALSNSTRVIVAFVKLVFLADLSELSLAGLRSVCCDGCCAASAAVSACSISCAEAGCESTAKGGCAGADGLDGSAGERSAREKSA